MSDSTEMDSVVVWFLVPVGVTLLSFAWALLTPAEPPRGPEAIPDEMPLVRLCIAGVASFACWIVWALFIFGA